MGRQNLDEGRVNKHGLLGDVDDVLHLLELGRQVVEVAHVDHHGDLLLVERVGGDQGEVVLEGNECKTGVQNKGTKQNKRACKRKIMQGRGNSTVESSEKPNN